MNFQLQAHNIDLSEEIKKEIRSKAEKLKEFHERINRCRVVVDMPHRHSREGILYDVRIDMTVPGAEIVIKRQANEDLNVAIRDAFDVARRKLEDHARLLRGDIKYHEELPHASISALFLDEGYGFLATSDGKEIYFHGHSVINCDFKHLSVGMKVRFVEESGEKGLQASTVTVIEE
ncbi:MAG: HPF/RaiA family ribosome-associated protein [Thermodesulfovibrionales bacterium]|nr:HPF/RaiA family ribosome-associated protein [Thermodesulfovibrionales bacterium]